MNNRELLRSLHKICLFPLGKLNCSKNNIDLLSKTREKVIQYSYVPKEIRNSMRKMQLVQIALILGGIVSAPAVHAQQYGENVVYGGIGAAEKDHPLNSDKTPFSAGYLRVSNAHGTVVGLDVGGEGTMLDSTWGKNRAVKQALSINGLFGGSLLRGDNYRIDAMFLLGARETFSDCPSSYLGYQCYADTPPDTSYRVNYGAVLTMAYSSFTLGVRITGESKQGLVGFRF